MSDPFLEMAISRGLLTKEQAAEVRRRGGSSREIAVSLGYIDEDGARVVDGLIGGRKEAPKIFAGRYEILDRLGQGGMGVVYKARDTRLDRIVALKGIASTSEQDLLRFEREARTAAKLNHPNIVQVHDVAIVDEECYLTMEYIDGKPLGGVRLQARKAVQAVLQAAEALHYAHEQGVIHRDVKPENILLDAEGRAHLSDFGLAKPVKGSRITVTGAVMGTPAYMSPEQARGGAVDARSDVYSLGATLYHLLSGAPPFDAPVVLEVLLMVQNRLPPRLTGVVRDLETVVMKCLEKDPKHRYATAGELAEDLGRFLRGEPVLARATPLARRIWFRIRRRPVVAVSIAVLLILSVVGVYTLRSRGEIREIRKELGEAQDFRRRQKLAEPYIAAAHSLLSKYEQSLEQRGADDDLVERYIHPAIRELQSALRHLQDDPRTWYEMGKLYHLIMNVKEAETCYGKALELDAEYVLALMGRARMHMELYRGLRTQVFDSPESPEVEAHRERAEEDLARVREISPDAASRGAVDAWLAILRGSHADAEPLVRRVLEERPKDPQAHALLGIILLERRELEEALSELNRSLELQYPYYLAMFYRGEVLGRLERYEEAVRAYDGVVQLLPEFDVAYANRGIVRLKAGDAEGGLQDAERCLRMKPASYIGHYAKLQILHGLERFDELLQAAEEALGLHPDNAHLLHYRGLARSALGDPDGAVRDLKRAVEQVDDDADLQYGYAFVLAAAGRKEEAVQRYTKAIDLNPKDARAWTNRAVVRSGLNDKQGAYDDYCRALEIDENHVTALINRGGILKDSGHYDLAEKDLDRAIRLQPDAAAAYYNRGGMHFGRKNWAAAVRDWEKACDLEPMYRPALERWIEEARTRMK